MEPLRVHAEKPKGISVTMMAKRNSSPCSFLVGPANFTYDPQVAKSNRYKREKILERNEKILETHMQKIVGNHKHSMSPRALKLRVDAMKTQPHKRAETFNAKVAENIHGRKVHGRDLEIAHKPLIDKLYKKRRLEQMSKTKKSISPMHLGSSDDDF